ncbi:hypothetical protein IP92_00103 [Pseudoduganella flava]|uniref:Uncharacterized protein n=1 Tax=Pseudoduganella flava TaxID=871742 RepID=A0A562Q335_9BURK|nr:hypothetical protein [Pseudoduganella flava]QGZ41189.1 hypothetical protein GO485_20430 [Pseudoduganella flava]TWI51121.1 hypothetical protein IP92_00103 [Pseudoduganella flava]
MTTIRQAALVLPLFAALNAASAVEVAEMTYRPDAETTPKPLVQNCAINVALSDGRTNRDTIGRIDITESVVAGDMLPWLGAVVDRLSAYGYTVVHGAPGGGGVNVEVRLTRAYTFYVPGHLGGMLALEVAVPGRATPVKIRGAKLRPWRNWGGAANHVAALNGAADGVVDDLAKALSQVCPGVPAA